MTTTEQRLEILRDLSSLNGLIEALEGGAEALPRIARGDLGAFWQLEIGRILSSELVMLDAVNVDATAAGASTFGTQAFSFPTVPFSGEPAGLHRILEASVRVADAQFANVDHCDLFTAPFRDPDAAHVGWVTAAGMDALGGGFHRGALTGAALPLWGRADQEYTFRVRSNAGGGATARLELLVAIAPPGLVVPP